MADAATISVLIQARDQASAQLKNVETRMGSLAQSFSKHRRTIGLASTAIGGAITGIAALSVKSSLDQQVGINRLDQALKNVGSSYADQKVQIEKVAAAQQLKTNYGDEAQREALQKLIVIGGQWEGSLAALKITTDVAAGANIDLNAAALLVGKAIAGETSSLSRYGIILEKGATQTEIMAALTKQFGGSAEAAADPLTQLKNRMGDLFQVLGDALLPMLEKMLPMVESVTRRVIEWAEAHPTLTKVLALVGTALGAILLVLGPLILLLPTIVAGVGLLSGAFAALSLSMGPITAIVLGLTAVIAAGILIYKNWDAIIQKLQDNWKLILPILAIALGPIGLITAAIAAGVLIWKNWDVVVQTVKESLAAFAKFVIDVGIKVAEGARAMIGWIPGLGGIKEGLDNAIHSMKGMKDGLDDWVDTAGFAAKQTSEAFGDMEDTQMKLAKEAKKTEKEASKAVMDLATNTDRAADDVVAANTEMVKSGQEMSAEMQRTFEKIATGADTMRSDVDRTADSFHDISLRIGSEWQRNQEAMAESSRRFALDTAAAWRDIEDTMIDVAITQKAELERMAMAEQRSAELFAAISEARVQTTLDESQARKDAFWDSVRETERAEQRHDRTLSRLAEKFDKTLMQWDATGAGMEDVVRAWADTTDMSIGDVLERFDLLDLDTRNVKDVLTQFTKDTGQNFFTWAENLKEATDKAADGLRGTKKAAEDAAEAVVVGFGVTPTQVAAAMAEDITAPTNAPGQSAKPINLIIGNTSVGTGSANWEGARNAARRFGFSDDVINAALTEQAAGNPRTVAQSIRNFEAQYGRARGGWASGRTLVGERGPEIVNLPPGSYVNPHGSGSMGGGSNTFHFHGAVYGLEDLRRVVVEAVRDHAISGGFRGVFGEA